MKGIKKAETGLPLVSVVMPVYNGGHYIRQAIQSIINQTYQNFEFLIVDDGSTDSSWKIIKNYQQKFPYKLKIFKLPKHIGTFAATNFALDRSKGKFIALMDCDDISHPDRLEKQVDYLQKNKDVIVLGSQVNVINEKGEIIGAKSLPTGHHQIYKKFAVVYPLVHPSIMVRRILPNKKKFRYFAVYGVNDDYYTFFSILNLGKFNNLQDRLLNYRIHKNNFSMMNLRQKFIACMKIRFQAFRKFKYPYSALDIFLVLIQALIVYLTPEKYLLKVYLLCRQVYYGNKLLPYVFNKKNFN